MTKIIGDKELQAKLRKLSDLLFIRPHIGAALVHLNRELSKYPTGEQHRPQPFKTAKSRRWFFWALRNNMIEVPYRRGQSPGSEDIANSWTREVNSNTRGTIGSDASYGGLVQGWNQTGYHKKTGWKTTDTVVKEESAEVLKEIQKAVDKELRK